MRLIGQNVMVLQQELLVDGVVVVACAVLCV